MSQTPYQPPAPGTQPEFLPPAQTRPLPPGVRPVPVTVLGILNLVFGFLGGLGLVFSVVLLLFMPSQPGAPNPTVILLEESVAYRWFSGVLFSVGLLVIMIQIVGAIGALNLKQWGRKSLVGCSLYSLTAGPILTVVNLVWLYPTTADLGGMIAAITIGSTIVGCLVGLVLPAATAYFMTRPHVKLAFDINPNG